jgi:hypothetical protein
MGGQLHGLVEEIENCRQEMVRLATETSIRNKQVIETSTRLDLLLNKYYSLTADNKKKAAFL